MGRGSVALGHPIWSLGFNSHNPHVTGSYYGSYGLTMQGASGFRGSTFLTFDTLSNQQEPAFKSQDLTTRVTL